MTVRPPVMSAMMGSESNRSRIRSGPSGVLTSVSRPTGSNTWIVMLASPIERSNA
jgi:hypothetical protein